MMGHNPPQDRDIISKAVLEKLMEAIKSIKHGSVTLIIQDGHVIQIDKSEKLRLK